MNQELLSLLTARVQRFHLAPGGIPNLTPEDIAHALGMVRSEDACLYGRIKYCGEVRFLEDLARSIRRRFLEQAADSEWRIPRPGFLLDLSYLLLLEAIDPNTCTVCWGRAEVRPEVGPVIRCEDCDATGKRKMRDLDRARLVNVSRQSWANTWGERYGDMQIETTDRWEDMLVRAVKKRLSA